MSDYNTPLHAGSTTDHNDVVLEPTSTVASPDPVVLVAADAVAPLAIPSPSDEPVADGGMGIVFTIFTIRNGTATGPAEGTDAKAEDAVSATLGSDPTDPALPEHGADFGVSPDTDGPAREPSRDADQPVIADDASGLDAETRASRAGGLFDPSQTVGDKPAQDLIDPSELMDGATPDGVAPYDLNPPKVAAEVLVVEGSATSPALGGRHDLSASENVARLDLPDDPEEALIGEAQFAIAEAVSEWAAVHDGVEREPPSGSTEDPARALSGADSQVEFEVEADQLQRGQRAVLLSGEKTITTIAVGADSFVTTQARDGVTCWIEQAYLDKKRKAFPPFVPRARFQIAKEQMRALGGHVLGDMRASLSTIDWVLHVSKQSLHLRYQCQPVEDSEAPGEVRDRQEVDPRALADALKLLVPFAKPRSNDPQVRAVSLTGGEGFAGNPEALVTIGGPLLKGIELNVEARDCAALCSALRRLPGKSVLTCHAKIYTFANGIAGASVVRHEAMAQKTSRRLVQRKLASISVSQYGFYSALMMVGAGDNKMDGTVTFLLHPSSTSLLMRRGTVRSKVNVTVGIGPVDWPTDLRELEVTVRYAALLALAARPSDASYDFHFWEANGQVGLEGCFVRSELDVSVFFSSAHEPAVEEFRPL